VSFLIEFTCARAPLTKPNAADIGFIAAIFFLLKIGYTAQKAMNAKKCENKRLEMLYVCFSNPFQLQNTMEENQTTSK